MKHLFLTKTNIELIQLKTDFKATLNNPVCEPIHENYRNNIKQIDDELLSRGIKPLKHGIHNQKV